jgi:hypothetical protein
MPEVSPADRRVNFFPGTEVFIEECLDHRFEARASCPIVIKSDEIGGT